MKKKKLHNTSEYKTYKELREALKGTGFKIESEMQVSKVIEREDHDKLSKKDKQAFNNASFDFVVYNEESIPEFVIEFDGPHHSQYEKKREADIRKNRLCSQANLSLLRIDDSFISEYEEISILKYIVERFLAYRREIEDISRDIEDRLSLLSNGGIDYDDPWNDPGVIFDLTHPFPASVEIAERLLKNFEVITNHIDVEIYNNSISEYPHMEFSRNRMGEWPIGDYRRRIERSYLLAKNSIDISNKFESEMIHELSVAVDYEWGLPTVDRKAPNQVYGVPTVHFQGLPGTSISELSNHLCDFLALRELEKWAQSNL